MQEKNPYPPVDIDEESGVETPSEKARAWQEGHILGFYEGYDAGYKDAIKKALNIMVGSKK